MFEAIGIIFIGSLTIIGAITVLYFLYIGLLK